MAQIILDNVTKLFEGGVAAVAQAQFAHQSRILIDVGSPGATATPGNWNNFTVQPSWSNSGMDQYLVENAAGTVVNDCGSAEPGMAIGVANMDDVRSDSGTSSTWNCDGITYPYNATRDIVQTTEVGDAAGPFVNDTLTPPGAYPCRVIISGVLSANVTLLCSRDNAGSRLGYFRVNGGAIQAIDAGHDNGNGTFGGMLTFYSVGTTITLHPGGTGSQTFNDAIMIEFWGDSASNNTDLNTIDLMGDVLVPEPATLGLLALGALAALKRRC